MQINPDGGGEGVEKIFYKDNNVTVTQSRFISGDKTYAMRNISSVVNFKIEKNPKNSFGLIALGVVLMLLLKDRILGCILIVIGVIWLFMIKRQGVYTVRINSNSGEVDALISKDAGYVQSIVDALNDAIIYRG